MSIGSNRSCEMKYSVRFLAIYSAAALGLIFALGHSGLDEARTAKGVVLPDDSCFVYRGDLDHSDGGVPVNIVDVIYLVDYLFFGGPPPVCEAEGDVDASGAINVADLTYLVDYLFFGGPPPPPRPGKDYVVYFKDDVSGGGMCYGYHPLTSQVDSFSLPAGAWWGMTVSSDGTILYVVAKNDIILVVDLDTETIITELPYEAKGGVAVSPDGQLVAILGDDLYILNTSDYSLVFHDTSKVLNGVFSSDGRSLYCTADQTGTGSYHAYKVDLENDFLVTREWFADGMVVRILPSVDQQKWFLYLCCSDFCSFFEVYDVECDSIIFSEFITPGGGYMALTPDGKYLFYTNPGGLLFGPPPPSSFTAFDVEANDIYQVISTAGIPDCMPMPEYFPVGEIAITPDGRWLIGLGAVGCGGPFLLNINTMEIEDCFFWNGKALICLTCQNSP